MCIKHDS